MFKELFTEGRSTQRRGDEKITTFELFKGDELLFTTRSSNGADQIDKKLKQKKYKDADRVMRHLLGDYEDVTDLFIKGK